MYILFTSLAYHTFTNMCMNTETEGEEKAEQRNRDKDKRQGEREVISHTRE